MPELPDVAGFKQYLDATALHQRIVRSSLRDKRFLRTVSKRQFYARVTGSKLEGTVRHGKYLLAGLSEGGCLVLHFGMTGELKYHDAGREEPEYTKLLLTFENGRALAYINRRRLGEVDWVESVEALVKDRGLGPDALDGDLTGDWFVSQLRDRRGAVKAALMNQKVIAGIGNIYSDEILFQTGLHPQTSPADLGEDELRGLFRSMRTVLRTAARKGGDIRKLPRGYLLRAREEGRPCPGCGGDVKKATVSGRTAHFCPKCQEKR